jgi:CTD small phosphatase-like protein 2
MPLPCATAPPPLELEGDEAAVTPVPPPACAAAAPGGGFITSTTQRKRRPAREGGDAAADDAALASPAVRARRAAPGDGAAGAEDGGAAGSEDAGGAGCPPASPHLFSPKLFKAAAPASPGADAAAAAAADGAPAASTDASTGTSASLDDSGCTAPAAAAAAGPLSPAAAAAAPAEELAAEAEAEAGAQAQQPAAGAEEEDEEAAYYEEFDPFLFIRRLPARAAPPSRARAAPLLPRQTRVSGRRKTLVLDLDETLVHSSLDPAHAGPPGAAGGLAPLPAGPPPDFCFPVDVGAVRHRVAVRRRPHLQAFLERAAELFEVVVFTASQRVYAEQLLDAIDPGRRLVRHRLYRESCVLWGGNYLKDLSALGRDLAHTLIVDNSPQAFGLQVDNGVPIESWYDDAGDDQLLALLPVLEALAAADDVRPALRDAFGLWRHVAEAGEPGARAPDFTAAMRAAAATLGGKGAGAGAGAPAAAAGA